MWAGDTGEPLLCPSGWAHVGSGAGVADRNLCVPMAQQGKAECMAAAAGVCVWGTHAHNGSVNVLACKILPESF